MRSNAVPPAHFALATNASVLAIVTPTLVPVHDPGPISARKRVPWLGSKPEDWRSSKQTAPACIRAYFCSLKSTSPESEKIATDATAELVLKAKITVFR